MILGTVVPLRAIAFGGMLLFLAITFQVLVGLRKIKLGRNHTKIHKWTGIGILVVAVFHGFLGITVAFGLTIL